MKRIAFLLFVALACVSANAQDITGDWYGLLKVPGVNLRLVFHITRSDTGYSATMDSPDQNARGIPVTTITLEDNQLKMTVSNLMVEYTGTFDNGNINDGVFRQAGQAFPMNLSRNPIEKEPLVRPQEPVKPFPYREEEVAFSNPSIGITLSGTLTIPNGESAYPAAILITGSGPQNRDEEIAGHKPFLVLADHLTRNGIAVLRYDDRGTGKSAGTFGTATSEDFATDVEAAIAFLKTRKEITPDKIGLVGHSEGGLIAPLVASRSKDTGFIVMLAGPGIRGSELLSEQAALIGKSMGMNDELLRATRTVNETIFDLVLRITDPDSLRSQLHTYLSQAIKDYPQILGLSGMPAESFLATQVNQLASPWMTWFIRYDPAPALEKVACPVLALFGEKDLQVPPVSNLPAVEAALRKGGNKNFSVRALPNLNHLFQEASTGSPSEYATIEQTISPVALNEISEWIRKVNGSK